MAQPLPFRPPARDPRAELEARLASAPETHAEAMLAAYEVLQGLHDRGVFEVLRGLLGSGDKVLDVAVSAANGPGSIGAVRNLVLLANLLAEIDPAVLGCFTRAVPEALRRAINQPEPPGLWALVRDFLWNQDFRHGLAAVNVLLEGVGRGISGNQVAAPAAMSATNSG
jgi:hypothetical protein